ETGVLHQEADRRAVRPAAEAVVELLGRTDGERGRLLGVERTEPQIVRTRLLQPHVAAHHVDDVDAGEKVLDEALGNHPASLTGHRLSARPASRAPAPRRPTGRSARPASA